MIWHIAKKDFLNNIVTPRFILGFILCLLLIPYTIYTGVRSYEESVVNYENDQKEADDIFNKTQAYSRMKPIAIKPPNPLSIFYQGVNDQVGNKVVIGRLEKPLFATGVSNRSSNPFMNGFMALDFINIMVILLSLLGIFFSYDLISREKQDGTLKLSLANSISLSRYFMGKIAGIYLTVLPILGVCSIAILIIVGTSSKVMLSADDYLRLGILAIASLIYFSLFVFLGAYISTRVEKMSTGIVVNLFIWSTLLFLIPNTFNYLGKSIVKIDDQDKLENEIVELVREKWDRYTEIAKKAENEGYRNSGWNVRTEREGGSLVLFTRLNTLEFERRTAELRAPIDNDYVDKKWALQEAYLSNLVQQQKMIKYLSCISPGEILKFISGTVCKTGAEEQFNYMEQTRQYHDQFCAYFIDNGIYSSFNFVTPHSEEEIPKDQDEADRMYDEWEKSANIESSFDTSSLGYLDTSDFPRFQYRSRSIIEGLEGNIALLGGVIIVCLFLSWISYISFIRYDKS